MGVYIKGMEMPKRGESCLVITIMPDGEIYKNVYDASFRVNQVGEAVPVPPHGRLGDLDKLENGLRHMAKYQHGERQQGILGCCETIRLAPTVIEAEEGET